MPPSGMSRNGNHAVRQQLCTGSNNAKTKSWINEGIISLSDFVRHAVIVHRLGRNPRSDKGTSSVQAIRSLAVASASSVGLLSGNMIGRFVWEAISLTIVP